ncbi:MAG: hypothetical protein ACTS80_00350 [Candidatus Hodgkinia cicadicola]
MHHWFRIVNAPNAHFVVYSSDEFSFIGAINKTIRLMVYTSAKLNLTFTQIERNLRATVRSKVTRSCWTLTSITTLPFVRLT